MISIITLARIELITLNFAYALPSQSSFVYLDYSPLLSDVMMDPLKPNHPPVSSMLTFDLRPIVSHLWRHQHLCLAEALAIYWISGSLMLVDFSFFLILFLSSIDSVFPYTFPSHEFSFSLFFFKKYLPPSNLMKFQEFTR